MGKVIITGDLHCDKGIWVDICLNYLTHLQNYATDNNINDIIIDGDIFEKSTKIKNESFVPLFFKFMELKEKGFNLYFILGNHDVYNIDNESIVKTFLPFGKVIQDFDQFEIQGKTIDMLAYTKEEGKIPDGGDILITHLSIASFTFDNNYHVNEKIAFSPDQFENYNIVFSGHFHRHQHKKNIVYVGSPYQLNFGEKSQSKGFVVLDVDTYDWEFVEYNEAPKFIIIKPEDFQTVDVSNCFVKVKITEKLDNYIKLKHLLYEKGAIEVIPDYREEVDYNIDEENTDIDFNGEIKESMVEYINKVDIEDVDNEKLLEIFEELLAS